MSMPSDSENLIRDELVSVYTSLVREAQAGLKQAMTKEFTGKLGELNGSITSSIQAMESAASELSMFYPTLTRITHAVEGNAINQGVATRRVEVETKTVKTELRVATEAHGQFMD